MTFWTRNTRKSNA